jgi:hypothetical protein
MKKLLFAVAIVAISTSAFAQKKKSSDKGGIQFGLHAGVNIATIHSKVSASGQSASETSGSLVGLNAGAEVIIPLTTSLDFQGEVGFSQLGGKDKTNSDNKLVLSYIPIGAFAKYKVQNSGLGIYIGPQLGILATAKAKGGGETVDVKESMETIDIAGVFGVEYLFSSSTPVGISARYQMGFSNISKNSSTDFTETDHNNAVTVLVFYRFGGKK